MPLKRKGKVIYHKVDGKWVVKATAKSVESAKKYMRVQQGIAHGWKPTKKK